MIRVRAIQQIPLPKIPIKDIFGGIYNKLFFIKICKHFIDDIYNWANFYKNN